MLALQLADRAGITAAQARVVDSDGVPVALVRRFDRLRHEATAEEQRLLYVSAATLLGIPPADSADHAYTEIADVIRQRSADAAADLEELWRRIAFSILITNVDDHLHNHGFLHVEGDLWRLSPAFDINPFPDRARELKTWISEDVGPDASVSALMSTARYFGLSRARATSVLTDVEHAVASWQELATRIGFSRDETEQFREAFEHPERRIAQRLIA